MSPTSLCQLSLKSFSGGTGVRNLNASLLYCVLICLHWKLCHGFQYDNMQQSSLMCYISVLHLLGMLILLTWNYLKHVVVKNAAYTPRSRKPGVCYTRAL